MTEHVSVYGGSVKLSIITIHLNNFAGLERTLRSLTRLLVQNCLEWVVIDGGSEQYGNDIDLLKQVKSVAHHFVSEPDNGVYDAMNKGTSLATSEYLLYLNAGDELHPDFDPRSLSILTEDTHPDMVWGYCLEKYENGELIQIKTRTVSWAWYGMPAYHPAIIFRRDILGSRPYDSSYRIAADYDLVCRLIVGGKRVSQVNLPISIFHRGGVSEVQSKLTLEEENQVRLKYFNVPRFAGTAIKGFKGINSQLAKAAWLRKVWRRWI